MKISYLDYIDPNSITYNLIYQPFPILMSNLNGISSVQIVESKYNNQDIRIVLQATVTQFLNTVSFVFYNTMLPTATAYFTLTGNTSTPTININDLFVKQTAPSTWYVEFTSRESTFGNIATLFLFGTF